MSRWILFLLLFTATLGAHDRVPAPESEAPILIRGATVHTAGPRGTLKADVLIVDGRLSRIEADLAAPEGASIVDAGGRHLYPGMIAGVTALGLSEISAIRPTRDNNEVGEFNPGVKARIAYNTDSEHIPVNRTNGLLHAHVLPSGGVLSGQGALMRLDGWNWEDATVVASTGVALQWPRARSEKKAKPGKGAKSEAKGPGANDPVMDRLERYVAQARSYREARRLENVDTDQNFEAMIPVLEGERPLFVNADRRADIEEAVAWTTRHAFKMVLVGGAEAGTVAPLLKKHDIPVIITMTLRLPPHRDSSWDAAYTLPARLHKAGVRYCLAASGSPFGIFRSRALADDAGVARAFGLDDDEALKAITRYPAEILGAGTTLGSLEIGKDASLILTDGDLLETTTRVEAAWIRGRPVDLENRQTRLVDKYQKKLENK